MPVDNALLDVRVLRVLCSTARGTIAADVGMAFGERWGQRLSTKGASGSDEPTLPLPWWVLDVPLEYSCGRFGSSSTRRRSCVTLIAGNLSDNPERIVGSEKEQEL